MYLGGGGKVKFLEELPPLSTPLATCLSQATTSISTSTFYFQFKSNIVLQLIVNRVLFILGCIRFSAIEYFYLQCVVTFAFLELIIVNLH